MYKNRPLFITSLLLALLLVLTVPGSGCAANQPAVTLEQSIQTVRANFTIPAAFTDFTSSFNQSDSSQVWYLAWNNPDQSGGSFSAQVDAATGEVISMNTWQPETGSTSRIPSISWVQAQEISAELLQRLIPSRISSLVMIADIEPNPISSSGPTSYTINWRRVVNQIPVEGVAAWVTVDAHNGGVTGYNLSWSNLPMPDPAGVITPAAAQQGFTKAGLIQLEYMMPEKIIPYADRSKTAPSALLVYLLDHPSNGAIDAFTGVPLVPETLQRITGGGAEGLGGGKETASPAAPPVLTPEETAEIIRISGLISQDQAAATVLKWAAAGSDLVLQSASLEQDWRDPNLRIWSLSWSAPAGAVPWSSWNLYGRVDARTAELLGFSLALPTDPNLQPSLSQTAAQQKAEDFLRRIQGERFSQFRLEAADMNELAAGKTLPGSEPEAWSFKFIRIVNGIRFPGNGADLVVDRTNQKIISYNLNWLYDALPSAAGVLGLERANQVYLQSAPLTLTYAAYFTTKGDTEMRLIYVPQVRDGQPSFRMLDAYNGTLLDYQGQPVEPVATTQAFKDIGGNFAAKEIMLLAKSGLMTEYGDAFHPQEEIKMAALLRAMLGAYQGSDSIRSLSDADTVQRAIALGWLKESLPPEASVSRGLLAQILVRALNLAYLADLADIYQIPYQDSPSIGPDLKGYAALCWGLEIIKGNGVRFEAQHLITRAEAAAALVRSLGVER